MKRKATGKIQLHYLDPKLRLFDNEGNSRREAWKDFKTTYNVNKATKKTLLTGQGRPSLFNRRGLSYGKGVLQGLPREQGIFQIPQAKAYYMPYEMKDNELG